ESDQVMMTPAVVDLDGDLQPDIVFTSYPGDHFFWDGNIRAVRGSDGSELFTVTNPAYGVSGFSNIAVGDIDGDGRPEIVAVYQGTPATPSTPRVPPSRLIAFEHDGTFKWLSPVLEPIELGGP